MRGAAALAAAACVACAGDAPAPASATEGPPPADPLAELRAIGYAGWDEVDGGLAPGGATVHDRSRVAPGTNLYADDRDRVLEVDVDGEVLREWTVPGRTQVETARLLPGGRLLALSVDEGLTLLEPDGSLAWHADLAAHHDVAARPEDPVGRRVFAVATHTERPHAGRRVRFDEVRFVAEATGAPVEGDADLATWCTWEHREELQRLAGGPHPLDEPATAPAPADIAYDYFHLNSIAFDGRDRLLLCLRNVDLVLTLDLRTREVLWSAGPGTLDWPHTPRRVAPDRVLVLDNGRHRGWSRAVELDEAGAVVWEWRADPPEAFFTDVRGSVQRLGNGNTLLCESERGRALEVAPDGAVVWEFHNPEVVDGRRRRIYRFERLEP